MEMKKLAYVSALIAVLGPVSAFSQTVEGLTPYAQIRAYAGVLKQSASVTQVRNETDMDYVQQFGTTRAGLKGKYGTIDGLVELGLSSYNSSKSNAVSLRKAYAVWNQSDAFSVKVGQDDAPYTFYASSVTFDNVYNGMGDTAQSRDFQIKLIYSGAFIDFLSPASPGAVKTNAGTDLSGSSATNWDILFPKTALGYDYISSDKTISAGACIAYQASVFDGQKDGNAAFDAIDNKRVDAGLFAVHAAVTSGGFSAKINGGYGINSRILGIDYSSAFVTTTTSVGTKSTCCVSSYPELDATGKKFKNTTSMEGFVELAYNLGFAEFRGAVGYVQAKNGNWDKTDAQMAYYLQSTIPLVEKRFNLIPEVSYLDYMNDKNGNRQGYELGAGVMIQILL
jgi:ferredoxin